MKKIFALVGPSGAGKTSLILEILKRMPDQIAALHVLTTRARRGPEDDIFCQFVDKQEILRRRDAGQLIQYLEYAGNIYGCDRQDVESILQTKHGIQAYVESGVADLTHAGFTVIPIRIIPHGNPTTTDAFRLKDDIERRNSKVEYACTIENNFEPGGFDRALNQLLSFLKTQTA